MIMYVKIVERNIVIRTEDGVQEGSLTNQLDAILGHFGFARLNQNVIVNLSAIKSYDPELDLVYFDDEKLISCQVSRRNKNKLSALFDK